jgi:hypothetical protein
MLSRAVASKQEQAHSPTRALLGRTTIGSAARRAGVETMHIVEVLCQIRGVGR